MDMGFFVLTLPLPVDILPTDSIYKFPVVSQSRACQELAERAKQLQTMADSPLIAQVRHPLVSLSLSDFRVKKSEHEDTDSSSMVHVAKRRFSTLRYE